MNVHRRDRARLRLSSPTNVHKESGRLHQQQPHHPPNPCSTPLPAQRPLVYGNIPKASADPGGGGGGAVTAAPPLSPSRVSPASSHENCSEQTLVSPSYSSPLVKEDQRRPLFSIARLDSDPFSLQILTVPELKLGSEGDQKLKERDCEIKRDGRFEEEEVAISTKRRRMDVAIPFIGVGSSPDGSPPLRSEVLGPGPTPIIEELDLELRLGDGPKVK